MIDYVSNYVSCNGHEAVRSALQYNVLLVIVNSDVEDIEETVDKIVLASEAPISIVVVAVGSSNFE